MNDFEILTYTGIFVNLLKQTTRATNSGCLEITRKDIDDTSYFGYFPNFFQGDNHV